MEANSAPFCVARHVDSLMNAKISTVLIEKNVVLVQSLVAASHLFEVVPIDTDQVRQLFTTVLLVQKSEISLSVVNVFAIAGEVWSVENSRQIFLVDPHVGHREKLIRCFVEAKIENLRFDAEEEIVSLRLGQILGRAMR